MTPLSLHSVCRQLNEIWPTGGWGSIEYGTASVPGQVRRRRWCFLGVLLCWLRRARVTRPLPPLLMWQVLGGRWKPLHYMVRALAAAAVPPR